MNDLFKAVKLALFLKSMNWNVNQQKASGNNILISTIIALSLIIYGNKN